MIDPQAPAVVLPHSSVQRIPADVGSLVTVALTMACAVPANEVGGCCTNVTVGEAETIVVFAVAGFEGEDDDDAAMMVTVLPVGIT